jgi:arylformamidase
MAESTAKRYNSMSLASEPIRDEYFGFEDVYDISVPLEAVSAYPGDRQFSQEWMSRFEDGADYNLSALTLSSHAGTHLDASAHLLKNGRTLDKYPINRFIIPAHVIRVECHESIPASAISCLKINKGEALLFKTQNSRRGILYNKVFFEEFVYLSVEAARLCVSSGISLVGIDSLSVDKYEDTSLPAHQALLENDVLILEGIDLVDIPCGRYTLICLPLRVKDAEASPARAVLVR